MDFWEAEGLAERHGPLMKRPQTRLCVQVPEDNFLDRLTEIRNPSITVASEAVEAEQVPAPAMRWAKRVLAGEIFAPSILNTCFDLQFVFRSGRSASRGSGSSKTCLCGAW